MFVYNMHVESKESLNHKLLAKELLGKRLCIFAFKPWDLHCDADFAGVWCHIFLG